MRPWRGPSGGRSAEPAGRLPSSTQASVYCVAAILWTAAKFSIPRDHKLALPRRLKMLLLHMARRSAQERPSAAEAIEVTGPRRGGAQLKVQGPGHGFLFLGQVSAVGQGRTWLHLWTGGEGSLLLNAGLPPRWSCVSSAPTGRRVAGDVLDPSADP